ncbi:MAG: cytidyltransferase [Candidatus Helarchaeota archaeon]
MRNIQKHKQWTLLLGRWQCLPPHDGHIKLIRTILNQGKNVCIGLRKADLTDKNPYTYNKRRIAFEDIFRYEINRGKVCIVDLPDIIEIAYGRTPGWEIREVRLSPEIEAISGTKVRKKMRNKNEK